MQLNTNKCKIPFLTNIDSWYFSHVSRFKFKHICSPALKFVPGIILTLVEFQFACISVFAINLYEKKKNLKSGFRCSEFRPTFMWTSASVPAPLTSPVLTDTWYDVAKEYNFSAKRKRNKCGRADEKLCKINCSICIGLTSVISGF